MSENKNEDEMNQQIELSAKLVKKIMTSLNKQLPEGQLRNQLESIYRMMGVFQENLKNKKNARRAKGYLQVAKLDLEAARLLNKKRMLSLSIYHLQQAVEKTAKCCGVIFFDMSKKELKNFNHRSPLVFIEELKKELPLELIKSFYPQNEDFSKMITEAEKIINKSPAEIARFSRDEISQVLSCTQNLKNVMNKEEIESVISIVCSTLNSDERSRSVSISPSEIHTSLDFVIEVINLYFLSIITYPHEAYTRYPDGPIKPEDYNEDLGIVQMCKGICDSLEKTQEMIETLLDAILRWKK